MPNAGVNILINSPAKDIGMFPSRKYLALEVFGGQI